MSKYIIGVDVGGTNTKFGLLNAHGNIIARTRLATKSFNRSQTELINAIVRSIHSLIDDHRLKRSDILGIGMGWPGFIDPKNGIIQLLPNISGWKNVAVVKRLKNKLKLPVIIENDVNLITLAEWKKGAGIGCQDLICLTLGTGVGSGLILNGELYRGSHFTAGEIGHTPYLEKTLEGFVGNVVLKTKAARIFHDKAIRIEDVHALARKGNAKAKRFWRDVGSHLGFVLAGAVNLLNPKLIIIGGGVSNNFKLFLPALRRTIRMKSVPVAGRMVKVRRAKLGDDAGILGAFLLVKEAFSR